MVCRVQVRGFKDEKQTWTPLACAAGMHIAVVWIVMTRARFGNNKELSLGRGSGGLKVWTWTPLASEGQGTFGQNM